MHEFITRRELENLTGFSKEFFRQRLDVPTFRLNEGKTSTILYKRSDVAQWFRKRGLPEIAKKIENEDK